MPDLKPEPPPEPGGKKEYEVDLAGKKSGEQMKFQAQEMLLKDMRAFGLFVIDENGAFVFLTDTAHLDSLSRLRFRTYMIRVIKKHILDGLPDVRDIII